MRANEDKFRFIHVQGEVEYRQGQPLRMMGTVQDITRYKEAEELREMANNNLP